MIRGRGARLKKVFLLAFVASTARAIDTWETSAPDSLMGGSLSSMVILPSGSPAVSFLADDRLQYAWLDRTVWHTTTVDSSSFVGYYSSLSILPSGQPAISYYDALNDDLKYAWFNGVDWQTTVVDEQLTVYLGGGFGTSLAILPTGLPAIAYYDNDNSGVKYAWSDGVQWHIEIVENEADTGWHPSLAILPSGQSAISFQRRAGDPGVLVFATRDGEQWRTTVVDDHRGAGLDSSLAVLPSGNPAISHYDSQIDALKYTWFDGDSWHTVIVDSDGFNGWYTSLAVLPSGQPAVSYYHLSTSDLRFAWSDGSEWFSSTVDSSGYVGTHTSLAVLPSGQPVISYEDWANGVIKFALGSTSGDVDNDADVDLDDHKVFIDCLAGPDARSKPTPPMVPVNCMNALDFDVDNDLDLADFARFTTVFSGKP